MTVAVLDLPGGGAEPGGAKAMGKRISVATVAILALSGCGSADRTLEAGEWELVYEISDVTGPASWPPDVIASMKQAKQTERKCITPEQSAAPTFKLLLVNQDDLACNATGFSLAGGKIAGRVDCPASQIMGKVEMTMTGRHDARSFEMIAQSSVDNPGAPMRLKSRTTGRRVGDCPAGKKS
jgi:hypothetical protein